MTLHEDFHKIPVDRLNISIEKQADCYTRDLKPYIWKELWTEDYESLAEAVRDAKSVEWAHCQGKIAIGNGKKASASVGALFDQGPVI